MSHGVCEGVVELGSNTGLLVGTVLGGGHHDPACSGAITELTDGKLVASCWIPGREKTHLIITLFVLAFPAEKMHGWFLDLTSHQLHRVTSGRNAQGSNVTDTC